MMRYLKTFRFYSKYIIYCYFQSSFKTQLGKHSVEKDHVEHATTKPGNLTEDILLHCNTMSKLEDTRAILMRT